MITLAEQRLSLLLAFFFLKPIGNLRYMQSGDTESDTILYREPYQPFLSASLSFFLILVYSICLSKHSNMFVVR